MGGRSKNVCVFTYILILKNKLKIFREQSFELRVHPRPFGFPGGASGEGPACQRKLDIRDMGLISGSGRSAAGGHGNPPQYSCLENPMDREEPGRLQSMGSNRVGHD